MNRRTAVAALATSTVTAVAAILSNAPWSAEASTVSTSVSAPDLAAALATTVPSWAHHAPDAAVPGNERIDLVVQLATTDPAAEKRLAHDISDPASPSYRHFLTHEQYDATFAPSAASVATVRSVLTTAGVTVDQVSPRHTIMQVHAPASTVGRLFGTSFGRFTVHGVSLLAPLSTPQVPAGLAGFVADVAGLSQSAPLSPAASPSPAFFNARPCSAHYGEKTATDKPSYQGAKQPYAICGYTPSQLRKAYGLDKTGETGAGAAVGIVDAYASPTILADANTYATTHGDAAFATGQYVEELASPLLAQIPEDPAGGLLLDPQGWAGEETLDVEAVHGMAPGATVHYYGAATPFGPALYAALGEAVESGDVQVVSNSYGTASDAPLPSDQTLFDGITTTAALLGVTVAFSSGDAGDETANGTDTAARTGDFPATSDGVVAVGGTSLHVDAAGARTTETYWGTLKDNLTADGQAWDFTPADVVYSGGGGGGVSTTYAEPDWQMGVVPDELATYGGVAAGRVEPDISMDADSTTGMLVGQTQQPKTGAAAYSEYRIGGTSLSCPLFAGLVAQAVGRRGGEGLGFINPTMYDASKTAVGPTTFYDPADVSVDPTTHQSTVANVRPDFTDPTDPTASLVNPVLSSLRTLGNLATLHRFAGYDDSTGLGSPFGPQLVDLLAPRATGTPTGTPTVTPTTTATTSPTGGTSPTGTPTTSGSPTGTPTSSGSPTGLPTGIPTVLPTGAPTGSPTATGSTSPTPTGSGTPTRTPTPTVTVTSTSTTTATATASATATATASPTASPTVTPASGQTRTRTRIRLPRPVMVKGAKPVRLLFQVTGPTVSPNVVGTVKVMIDGKLVRSYNAPVTIKQGKQVHGFSVKVPRSLRVGSHTVFVTFTPYSSAYTYSGSRMIRLTVVAAHRRVG